MEKENSTLLQQDIEAQKSRLDKIDWIINLWELQL
jgi:hypothetical protein